MDEIEFIRDCSLSIFYHIVPDNKPTPLVLGDCQLLEYSWRHRPTNKSGTRRIVVHSRYDLLRLLNKWNHDPHWHYTTSIA